MNLYTQIENYVPYNEQELQDKEVMLEFIRSSEKILLRENKIAHFTASSWILNKERSKVLMIYHNIYDSWTWTGGHADGEEDLLKVALREAKEETGLVEIKPIKNDIFSIESLTVNGHIKRGAYVPSHLHLNVTYLLEADEALELSIKPDENSGVRWFSFGDAMNECSEPWMKTMIFNKLNDKCGMLNL